MTEELLRALIAQIADQIEDEGMSGWAREIRAAVEAIQ